MIELENFCQAIQESYSIYSIHASYVRDGITLITLIMEGNVYQEHR